MKCGVGDYLYSLASALTEHGTHENAVLTSSDACAVNDQNRFEVYPIINKWGLDAVPVIIRFIRKWRPDIVHIQYPSQGYAQGGGKLRSLTVALLPLLAIISNKRVVQTWHEYTTESVGSKLNFLLRGLVPSRIIVVRPDFNTNASLLVRSLARIKKPTFIRNASSIPKYKFSFERLSGTRLKFLQGQQRLIVFFGFLYPHKGAEQLFQIADPKRDQLLFLGDYEEASTYMAEFKKTMLSDTWSGKARLLGFLPPEEVSLILSIADAVILPFKRGGGEWNTSLHAAVAHHRFVITTSPTRRGYDKASNIYFCPADDIAAMKQALDSQMITVDAVGPDKVADDWQIIAQQHIDLYNEILPSGNKA